MSLLLNDLILNSFHKNNKSSIFDLSNYLNENQCKTQRIIASYIKSTNKNENNNNLNNINSYRKKLLIDNISNYKTENKNLNNKNEIKNNKRRLNSEIIKILNNDYLSESQKKNFNKMYNLISFKTINDKISNNKKENSFFYKNLNQKKKFLYHNDKLAKKRIDLKNLIIKNNNKGQNIKEQYYKGNKIYEKLNKKFGYEYDEHIKKKLFFKESKENKEYLNKKNNVKSIFNETYNLNDKFDLAINDYINIIKSPLSRNQSKEKIKNINLNLENSLKDEKKRALSSRNPKTIFNKNIERDFYNFFNNINLKTNESQFSNKLEKDEEIKQFKKEFDEKIF